jgi:integrase/recombinase XerD
MVRTGIRVSSAVALEVRDVDLARMKNDAPDTVFVGDELVEIVREHVGPRNDGALFTGGRGSRIPSRHISRRLRMCCLAAGIERPVSPHSLRHTFATRLDRRAGDLLLVRTALRHRSIASTLVHPQADQSRVRHAVCRLA